ncbi:twin transmembrane helix small protein [Roseibacterium sp. SDUM158016]|uniref:twin transmembrane helix small protein n=1 Tax=Roseicyclus sediminis TaxID=2980997 RepID=UPI0021D2C178|nr:twin transmembrane helix small protein [Roseibacterium sp. SDUM158016]MCU4655065.1 twin transmembrane helix small protein [Roseibacterium sp. SDUM158016]
MLNDPLLIIALLACFAVVVILMMGINSFRRGGEYARANSNKFMRWRLIAQLVAVVLILIFVYVRRQSGG